MKKDTEETLVLGGVEYTLSAHRSFGGFHSVWTCDDCGDTGFNGIHNSAEEAMDAAEYSATLENVQ
jgi:hypothetical protein